MLLVPPGDGSARAEPVRAVAAMFVQQQPPPPPQPPTTYFAPPPPTWLFVSRTGKILYASQAFLAASGYRSLAGSPLRLLFGQETCGETVRALAAAMSRAAPVRMLLALYCSAGATGLFGVSSWPVRDSSGSLAGFRWDITLPQSSGAVAYAAPLVVAAEGAVPAVAMAAEIAEGDRVAGGAGAGASALAPLDASPVPAPPETPGEDEWDRMFAGIFTPSEIESMRRDCSGSASQPPSPPAPDPALLSRPKLYGGAGAAVARALAVGKAEVQTGAYTRQCAPLPAATCEPEMGWSLNTLSAEMLSAAGATVSATADAESNKRPRLEGDAFASASLSPAPSPPPPPAWLPPEMMLPRESRSKGLHGLFPLACALPLCLLLLANTSVQQYGRSLPAIASPLNLSRVHTTLL